MVITPKAANNPAYEVKRSIMTAKAGANKYAKGLVIRKKLITLASTSLTCLKK